MFPTFRTLSLVLLGTGAGIVGCAHHEYSALGTAHVTSGMPEGPKVTNIEAEPGAGGSTDQLSAALCRHERACTDHGAGNSAGTAKAISEAQPPAGAACIAQTRPIAAKNLAALPCSLDEARAGFDACLSAIASDDCETELSADLGLVPACRPNRICAQR